MASAEILNFGNLPGSPSAAPAILGRSPGIDQDLADEVVRLCKGWGQSLALNKVQPAILSFPVKAKPKFVAKGAYAVIRVKDQGGQLFQVAILSQSDYAAFGYNPFALVEAGAFPDGDPCAVLSRLNLKPQSGVLPVSPPPSPDDVGMVDEALHQLLASHKLYLPIEHSTAESDRCLSLLIEVMPVALKKQLRFASFAPSLANGYHLAATATDGCQFSGWQRLMMTLVGGTLLDNQDRYVKKVRDCLAFGDLSVIKEQSRLLSLNRKNTEINKPTVPRVHPPIVAPVAATVTPKHTAHRQRPVPKSAPQRNAARPQLGQMRGSRRQLPGPVVAVLVMAMTLTGGWTYLEFFHGGGPVQWDELITLPGQWEESNQPRVASLLEVPNVGEVYHRQIKKIHRAGMIPGLNQETDQRRGLVNLKTQAAVPLLEQVDLFLELSDAGIRQGSRPDREAQRLISLTHQGQVLEVEMARLELAWHSLSSGVNWEDLHHLSDGRVGARRDSLQRAMPSALKAAAKDMKFGSRRKELGFGTLQVAGMSQLLVLFQANRYSKQWSRDLYRAAESVSPSASTMTRAYRNSAFTLVRLKNAEHQEAFINGAFVKELKPGMWPEDKVADILPGLRREVGKFNRNEAPPLLAGTLQLYQTLGSPVLVAEELATGKQSMAGLQENLAVQFDPEVYENYLQRIRYQAGLKNPELYPSKQQPCLPEFESLRQGWASDTQWQEQYAQQEVPFLKRWAGYEKDQAQQSLLADMSGFETTWNEVQKQVEKLRTQAEAGRDWTAVWVDLDRLLASGLAEGATLADQDPTLTSRYQQLQVLKQQVSLSHPLDLRLVTVRFNQDQLVEPEKVVFEFQIEPGGVIHSSEPFAIGPAAPAGSGWVGTTALDMTVHLSPEQSFKGVVKMASSGETLLNIEYPSLSERVGPGALARPRAADEGSLLIKTQDSWWRSLEIPHGNASTPAL